MVQYKQYKYKNNPESHEAFAEGNIQYSVMAENEQGTVMLIEKDEIFEHTIRYDGITAGSIVSLRAKPESCSYTLSSDNKISLKADINMAFTINTAEVFNAVTEIVPDDSVKKIRDGDYALKLYYGIENEEIWSIAKKYSTSVTAIMEENDLECDRLKQNGMILIPITG